MIIVLLSLPPMLLGFSGFGHWSSVMQFCNLTGRGTEVVAGVMVLGPLVSAGVLLVLQCSIVGDTFGAPGCSGDLLVRQCSIGVGAPGSFVDCGCWQTWGSESRIHNLLGPPPSASLDPFLEDFLATFCSLG